MRQPGRAGDRPLRCECDLPKPQLTEAGTTEKLKSIFSAVIRGLSSTLSFERVHVSAAVSDTDYDITVLITDPELHRPDYQFCQIGRIFLEKILKPVRAKPAT